MKRLVHIKKCLRKGDFIFQLPSITNRISHALEEALSDTVNLFLEETSTTIFKINIMCSNLKC